MITAPDDEPNMSDDIVTGVRTHGRRPGDRSQQESVSAIATRSSGMSETSHGDARGTTDGASGRTRSLAPADRNQLRWRSAISRRVTAWRMNSAKPGLRKYACFTLSSDSAKRSTSPTQTALQVRR